MSVHVLHQKKLQKSLKKERIYEMEKRYVSSFKANEQTIEYNALQDKYAFHYFTNRPVKKHLKRLAKAINLEPLTTQNQRMLSSLNEIIEVYNTHNVSERNVRNLSAGSKEIENPVTSAIKEIKRSNLNSQHSKKGIISHHLFDPYTQMMKPASIQKLKQLKLQSFRKKKINIGNKSNDNLRQGSAEIKQSTLIFKNKQKTQRSEEFEPKNRKLKEISKVELNNQTRHLKLIDFINKKKSELGSLHLHSKSPNNLSTPSLHQDFS